MKWTKFALAWFAAISAVLATVAAEQQAAGAAFTVHGRLAVYNGNPGCRIWVVGTKRILGVAETLPPETSFMPAQLRELLAQGDQLVFADFTVVPLTVDRPGEMRMVRVIRADRVVVTDGNLKLIRRIVGPIEDKPN